jgi:AraC-like DNA-binding protein
MLQLQPFDRLMHLFFVLREMSLATETLDLKVRESLPVSTIHSNRIQQVYQFIQTRYQDDVSTRQIASQLAMTESSFCRFFKQATGKTLKQVLTDLRIQKACLLLTGSDLSIASIASHAGFNNTSLFNRAFKRLTHQTPQQYRRCMQVRLVV